MIQSKSQTDNSKNFAQTMWVERAKKTLELLHHVLALIEAFQYISSSMLKI